MRWASTVSEATELPQAAAEVVAATRAALGAAPDLVVVFASSHHAAALPELPGRIRDPLGARFFLGCSAGGVIGGGREVENRPGLSLTAATLPEVRMTPIHLDVEDLPGSSAGAAAWRQALGIGEAAAPDFLVLPDPFTFDAERLVRGLDAAFPAGVKIGGLASGGRGPGQNTLFLNGELFRSGVVGVALEGNLAVDTIVAQGCRPIGEPMFVTRSDGNLVLELDGKRAQAVMQDLFRTLPRQDQEMFQHALFLGLVMHEARSEYGQGDFLIRNLLGVEPRTGALAVATALRERQVVQFHLRDARTSAEDLAALLSRHRDSQGKAPPAGSLLFSCLGRGVHLYGEPDHDTGMFRRHLGEVPLGGFFCNGEIGPVHGTTFLHGYTSSFGLFRPRHP